MLKGRTFSLHCYNPLLWATVKELASVSVDWCTKPITSLGHCFESGYCFLFAESTTFDQRSKNDWRQRNFRIH